MRWIWIDFFEEFVSGERARAVKLVSMAEDHVHVQYPGYPIMPHSLMIEGLAQTGGILAGEANDFSEKVVLAKIPKVEFYDHALAGDRLVYTVNLIELRSEGAITTATVHRDDQLLAEGEIFFAHLDHSRGVESGLSAKNFVFTKDHLMALLRMAKGSRSFENDPPAGGDGGQPVPPIESIGHAGPNGRPM